MCISPYLKEKPSINSGILFCLLSNTNNRQLVLMMMSLLKSITTKSAYFKCSIKRTILQFFGNSFIKKTHIYSQNVWQFPTIKDKTFLSFLNRPYNQYKVTGPPINQSSKYRNKKEAFKNKYPKRLNTFIQTSRWDMDMLM